MIFHYFQIVPPMDCVVLTAVQTRVWISPSHLPRPPLPRPLPRPPPWPRPRWSQWWRSPSPRPPRATPTRSPRSPSSCPPPPAPRQDFPLSMKCLSNREHVGNEAAPFLSAVKSYYYSNQLNIFSIYSNNKVFQVLVRARCHPNLSITLSLLWALLPRS